MRIGELINDLVDDFFDRERDRLIVDNRAGELTCEVDEARLTLLLKNLISNAMRYSSRDSGPIELAVLQKNSELILRVSDQGPGMSKEQAEGIRQVRPAGIDSCTLTNAVDKKGNPIRFKKDLQKVKQLSFLLIRMTQISMI